VLINGVATGKSSIVMTKSSAGRMATLLVVSALCNWVYVSANSLYPTRFEGVQWDNKNWRIHNTNLDPGHYQSRISLANGYLGINLASVGPFMDYDVSVDGDNINGWPVFDRRQSFATIAGFWDYEDRANGTNFAWLYQYGGESVISGVPHWAGLLVQVGDQLLNATVDPSQISNFTSVLDIRAGVKRWEYDWSPSQSESFHIHYAMFVHKLNLNQAAVQLKITSNSDSNITVIDVLDGDCALRTNFLSSAFDNSTSSIYSGVSPIGVPDVEGYIYSVLAGPSSSRGSLSQSTSGSYLGTNVSSIAQTLSFSLEANQQAVFTKYIGGASSDAFTDPQQIASKAALAGAKSGWQSLLASHKTEWLAAMPNDSVDKYAAQGDSLPSDPNLVELQITAVTNPFHMIQNTVGDNAFALAGNISALRNNSIQVCGLGSECYGGQIFWDADVWMAPGLVVSTPQAAQQIVNYRASGLEQAKKNVLTAYQSSQNMTGKFSEGGAVFPWTDARFHNCTGTGPCFDYEYHVNGDIGITMYNYYVSTGDADFFKENLMPTFDAVAWFLAELVEYNTTSGLYDLLNATDPDEYANYVDNPGYTMALIETHLERANLLRGVFDQAPNQTWANISNKVNVPVDDSASIILEFSAMNGSILVKQADVVLVDDFLERHNNYSLPNLNYYAGKQSPNGPGMTWGVFSIVANEISPSGCSAYTYDLYSSQPYTRAPWFQFSEQLIDDYTTNGGTHPAFPFLTGIGGAHRVAVYGYLGLRLLTGSLDITPNLPPQIPYLKYRTIYWQGWPISAWSNYTHTVVTRLATPLLGANQTFATQPIPVTSNNQETMAGMLSVNGSLTLRNREIGSIATDTGNIVQCMPVTSPQTVIPGQFPVSIVDGAISTKWQPTYSNETASVIIDLGTNLTAQNVSALHLDWAQNPPTTWQADFSDSSDFGNFTIVYNSTNVTVSSPYDATTVVDITAYASNSTNVTLDNSVPAKRYVRLSILGNQGDTPSNGATVAELGVIVT
jgi:trehalose/maltose hydrolase-like predicted phosphorylase